MTTISGRIRSARRQIYAAASILIVARLSAEQSIFIKHVIRAALHLSLTYTVIVIDKRLSKSFSKRHIDYHLYWLIISGSRVFHFVRASIGRQRLNSTFGDSYRRVWRRLASFSEISPARHADQWELLISSLADELQWRCILGVRRRWDGLRRAAHWYFHLSYVSHWSRRYLAHLPHARDASSVEAKWLSMRQYRNILEIEIIYITRAIMIIIWKSRCIIVLRRHRSHWDISPLHHADINLL